MSTLQDLTQVHASITRTTEQYEFSVLVVRWVLVVYNAIDNKKRFREDSLFWVRKWEIFLREGHAVWWLLPKGPFAMKSLQGTLHEVFAGNLFRALIWEKVEGSKQLAGRHACFTLASLHRVWGRRIRLTRQFGAVLSKSKRWYFTMTYPICATKAGSMF